jgi:hypothetical protein
MTISGNLTPRFATAAIFELDSKQSATVSHSLGDKSAAKMACGLP